MVRYTHDNLTLRQRLKARWRSWKLIVQRGAEMVEREGLGIVAATRLAAGQHNAEVDRRIGQRLDAETAWIVVLKDVWGLEIERGAKILRELEAPGKRVVAIAGPFEFDRVYVGSRIGLDQEIFPGVPPMSIAAREQCSDAVLVFGRIPGDGNPICWEPDVVTKYEQSA